MVKRAVVVGIDDYSVQDPTGLSIPSVSCCMRGAQTMYHLLIDGFGFDAAQIFYYTDLQASSENIMRALRYIIAQSEPGDVACFYYNGHGARLPQPGQVDRFYETIIPASGTWISDHEIFEIAAQLQQSVVNLTVILDSCHSGGMHDESEYPRTLSAVFSDELIAAMTQTMRTLIPCGICLPAGADGLENNVSNVRPAGNGSVILEEDVNKLLVQLAKSTLLAACRADESAWIDNSSGYSLLTKAFGDLVQQSNFMISYRDILEQLRTRVQQSATALGTTQTPQLRGQMNRMDEGFLQGWSDSR